MRKPLVSDMPNDREHLRCRPWLAGILNAVAGPLGYVYVGELRHGLTACLTVIAVVAAGTLLLARPHGLLSIGAVLAIALGAWALMIADAWRLARRQHSNRQPRPKARWFVYLTVLAVSIVMSEIMAVAIRTRVVSGYRIPSAAASPTLIPGDHVLVDNFTYRRRDPARYEFVLFQAPQSPGKLFIKRIVALPAETIEIRGGRISVDGQELRDPRARAIADATDRARPFGPSRVSEGQYFVLNENGDAYSDSRSWGTVPRRKVLGPVRSIYWSWDARDARVRWDRVGQSVR